MVELDLFEHYQRMQAQNIILAFRGGIFQDTLVLFAESVKSRLTELNGKPGVIKRIFTIFVELAQNIVHYSAERMKTEDDKPQTVGAGAMAVSEEGDHFQVFAGNLVRNVDVDPLVKRLETLRAMNKDALRQLYREKIREPRRENRPGGGVGLIEIARKADFPIQYRLMSVDETKSFFILSVCILKEGPHGKL